MKGRYLSVAFIALCAFAPCAPAQNALTTVPSRVLDPIDETNLITLKDNVHPLAQKQFDRGAAPVSMPTGRIGLVLRRSSTQQQALSQYLSDIQNPSSPAYHRWLTPAQYGASYGISESDLLRVESWLQSHGFRIEKVPAARNLIEFSGTFDQVQSAFHTSIHTFVASGETHFANASDPQIPAALAPVIAGVGPLNDFFARPMLVRGPTGRFDPLTGRILPELTLFDNNTPYLFVDPADAAMIYDTPNSILNPAYAGTTYDGTGVTIGIAGDSDLTSADVANYRMAFLGEASGSVNLPTVVVDGNDPGLNGDGDEALLDNEVAGGIAPKAKIYFYTSADTDISSGLLNAIFRAVDDNAVSILNISFGNCEAALGTTGNQIILETMEQAAAQGITVTVSAGDNGSAGCDDFDTESQATQGFAVNGFASTPYTVAVGGTDLDVLSTSFASYVNSTSSGTAPYYGTALKYIPENPWNDSTSVNTTYSSNVVYKNSNGVGNIVAGSGGVSSIYAKPSFQSSLTPNDGFRDVPDVSLLAGNGMYNAAWVICSDNVTDGVTSEVYTECQTSNGVHRQYAVWGRRRHIGIGAGLRGHAGARRAVSRLSY
jgi:trimeric autotransporter adhesin